MPIVDGDWIEDLTGATTTREVYGRELVYAFQTAGLTASMQVIVGDNWTEFDSLTANTTPKEKIFARPQRFRAVITGTGTATLIMSPSNPLSSAPQG